MVRTENNKQVSEMIFQALSDESINQAEPMSDLEIKVLTATIERLTTEGVLQNTSDLVTEPQNIINMLQENSLDTSAERQARKTLRRFREVIINLSMEPEIKILN